MIKELIPQVGLRYKFSKNYNNIFGNSLIIGTDEEPLSSSSSTCTITSADVNDQITTLFLPVPSSSIDDALDTSNPQFGHINPQGDADVNTDLRQLLEKERVRGKEILQSYKLFKTFNRSTLADIIIENQLKDDPNARINSATFTEISQKIAQTFPGELAGSYYIPYCKSSDGRVSTAKGILWDKYVNKRRNFRRLQIITKKSNTSTITSPVQQSENDNISSEELQELDTWLRNNVMPWNLVIENWQKTLRIRQKFETIDTYFRDYPSLRQPSGYLLLELDFDAL
ncbi:uncharacterized protein LOC116159847 [Photinus pyralis]|nr:uncharacterized protein LOC116158614 [Photinus pyralis]XP_031328791.1 uncharacterized protein LOC116159847 [Photinus pyralis]